MGLKVATLMISKVKNLYKIKVPLLITRMREVKEKFHMVWQINRYFLISSCRIEKYLVMQQQVVLDFKETKPHRLV
jgi:hypothetical protein